MVTLSALAWSKEPGDGRGVGEGVVMALSPSRGRKHRAPQAAAPPAPLKERRLSGTSVGTAHTSPFFVHYPRSGGILSFRIKPRSTLVLITVGERMVIEVNHVLAIFPHFCNKAKLREDQ